MNPFMAKKQARGGRRSPRGKYTAIPFFDTITLTTLAAQTVLLADLLDAQFVNRTFVMSVKALWHLKGLTGSEGPLQFGFAHNDLSVAEVKECLDAEVVDPSNIIAREQARRPVRTVGFFAADSVARIGEDGMIKTPIRFTVGEGHQLAAFVMNRDTDLLTTGATIEIAGTMFVKWI